MDYLKKDGSPIPVESLNELANRLLASLTGLNVDACMYVLERTRASLSGTAYVAHTTSGT